MASALYGEGDLTVGIHDVHVGYGCEAVVGCRFEMVFSIGAAAAIGGVTLDDGAADLVYKVGYEGWLQEVVASGLARRYLDGDTAFGLASQSLVYADEVLGRDLFDEIDRGALVGLLGGLCAGRCGGCGEE